MRYYIADPHFYHDALNTNMDNRGFSSVEEMNEYMLKRWNDKVRPVDDVYILGDLSWGSGEETKELLEKLNGHLYLINGNHDRFLNNKKYKTDRFVWIKEYAEVHDKKRKVILCHYPIMCYNGQYRRDRNGNPTTYMLYGHVHETRDYKLLKEFQEKIRNTAYTDFNGNTSTIPCNMINCFCKFSDYEPLSLDEWIALG